MKKIIIALTLLLSISIFGKTYKSNPVLVRVNDKDTVEFLEVSKRSKYMHIQGIKISIQEMTSAFIEFNSYHQRKSKPIMEAKEIGNTKRYNLNYFKNSGGERLMFIDKKQIRHVILAIPDLLIIGDVINNK